MIRANRKPSRGSGSLAYGVAMGIRTVNPSKIIAAPINYQSHIDLDLVDSEIAHKHTISHISHAGLFLKATSSLVGPGEGFEIQFP